VSIKRIVLFIISKFVIISL